MTWPETPTIERSRAYWVSQARIRAGRGLRDGVERAVVPLLGNACPTCGTRTIDDIARIDALFRHGGFGATRRTVRRHCPTCRWSLVTDQSEERPPR